MVCGTATAQLPDNASQREFLDYTHMLFTEGNKCYVETGNKTTLSRIIGELQDAVEQRYTEGLLSDQAADSLIMLRIFKLLGDYHYLNTDEDYASYDEAEYFFTQSLAYANDPEHSQYRDIYHDRFILYQELGQLYYKQKRYEEAYYEMLMADTLTPNFLSPYDDQYLDHLSQLAICKARVATTQEEIQEAIDDIDYVIDQYRDTHSERYGEAMRKKAKILMLQDEKELGDARSSALEYYKSYFAMKKEDALKHFSDMSTEDREHYWMRIRPFVTDCYRLEDADPGFLYDVTLFSKSLLLEYTRNSKLRVNTWQQIQQKLNTGECAIEFVQYEKWDERQMGALVLKNQGEPTFVWIGNVEAMMSTPLRDGGTVEDAITIDDPWMKNDLYSDSALFNLFWPAELLDAIGNDVKKVYFAPDGVFHHLAIEYMLPSDSLVPMSTEQLYRMTSTRQLVTQTSAQVGNKVLLCGNVNFDKADENASNGNGSDIPNDEAAYYFLWAVNANMPELPGTKTEIDAIRTNYDSLNVIILTDTMATEALSTQYATQVPIVHIATHGYFIGTLTEGTDLKPADYDESLSQNGLILAGANTSIASDDFNPSDHDGILSAREISQMDLSNVQLIVLSACQSGEGYVTEDGVYGLQRGLKNAGVNAMIVSLWSVDDEATSLLMRSFYAHLQTEDIHTAFNNARNELIQTTREPGSWFDARRLARTPMPAAFDLPQFYNAFILIDVK